ncbi:MAG: tetratricopeptide repeat protein [Desulfobulbaceae bacterium]
MTMLTACAPLGIELVKEENTQLRRGQDLLAQGDFTGALRENQQVLAHFPQTPPGDEALFNMGLIYVHYANPKRDMGLARVFFGRLEKEFPESPRRVEARAWGNILETLENAKRQDIEVVEKKKETPDVQESALLRQGQNLLARGDFAGALRKNQEVLARFPQKPPGDEALFNMGLLHVHYANPKRDIVLAQIYFARLAKEFPKSPLAEEARIWAGILDTMAKTRQIDIDIEEKKRELRR